MTGGLKRESEAGDEEQPASGNSMNVCVWVGWDGGCLWGVVACEDITPPAEANDLKAERRLTVE